MIDEGHKLRYHLYKAYFELTDCDRRNFMLQLKVQPNEKKSRIENLKYKEKLLVNCISGLLNQENVSPRNCLPADLFDYLMADNPTISSWSLKLTVKSYSTFESK